MDTNPDVEPYDTSSLSKVEKQNFRSIISHFSLYTFGAFGYALIYSALLSTHVYRYDPGFPNPQGFPVLAPTALVGIAALVGRFFNPIASVYVGHLSDHTQSKWGRRKPYMALAIFPLFIGFFLVYIPPVPSNSLWNAIYLMIVLIIFFLAFTGYMTPYLSLIAEITDSDAQRVRLSMLVAVANLFGNAAGLVISPLLIQKFGFSQMALCMGGTASLCLLFPLGIEEPKVVFEPALSGEVGFRKMFSVVIEDLDFRIFVISQMFMWIAINIFYLCNSYFVVGLLEKELGFAAVVNGFILIGACMGIILIPRLVAKYGKKKVLSRFLILAGINLCAGAIWPLWLKDQLTVSLLLILSFGISCAGLFVLPNAILAEIIDKSTQRTGQQRGGTYFGFQALVIAISSGISALITGFVLMVGKTALQPLGIQLAYIIAGIFAFASAASLLRNSR